MDETDAYLVWSHEHGKWWGPGGRGYVRSLARAGRYTRASALVICATAVPGTANRLGALPELPVRLADVMDMLRQSDGAAYEPGAASWE